MDGVGVSGADGMFQGAEVATMTRNQQLGINASVQDLISMFVVTVQEDMENYTKFKLMGGQKKLESDVVPHIFACQSDRKRAAPRDPRKTSMKRSRNQEIGEILSIASSSSSNTATHNMQNELLNSNEPNISTASQYAQTDSPPKKCIPSKSILNAIHQQQV
ncbi:hypothetical protein RN001_003784 [Aquatica leii]|uniref:Uncharacterized protein n=1 Tax=Aquatica leii TaxID=1421715 RepID=A0AAN7PJ30_9COLE|nr:hypothetical protein RN001_003784 [Aquatica leii]